MTDDVYESEMPDDTEPGGNFLSAEGSYHLVVMEADPRPLNKKNELIQGFKIKFCVLAGTVEGQKGKEIDLIFFNPRLDQKNQGEFSRKRQARFWLATGLVNKNDDKIRVSFDAARGRHVVARLEKDDDGKYLVLAYQDIFHVDDQEAACVPMDTKAIDAIPKEWRRIGVKMGFEETEYSTNVAADSESNIEDLY